MLCAIHLPLPRYRGTVGVTALLGLTLGLTLGMTLGLSSPAAARKPAPPRVDSRRAKAKTIFTKGQIHYKLGRFDKALISYTQAYKLIPVAGFLFNIGQCHRFLGQYQKAIYFYKGYLRESLGAPNLEVVKILIHQTQKKLADQASARARAQAQFTEGVRLYALGQVRQGLAKFQAAYQALPSPGYRYHIAQCYRKLKEWKQAVFFYEGYLRDNSATPMASLVEAHLKTCRKRLAEAEIKRRAILNPNLRKGGNGGIKVVPVYKKWWLWTVVAVAATALAIGLGAGLGLRDDGRLKAIPTTLGTVDWR
jgi:tetratricopeptide (TPR) repeat protein